jgi:cell wall-associated NlpC family hydrolase
VVLRTKIAALTLSVGCALTSTTAACGPTGLVQADRVDYPFTCNRASLTADFADRDGMPQAREAVSAWYRKGTSGHYLNNGWGPVAEALPAPVIPSDADCDAATWKRERILAVAMRYIYGPGNPLGLQYRHHHIPGWNPPTSTYAGAADENSDPDASPALTAWESGQGLDCSNFTAWVYNYGLGIKFNGNVHRQYDGTAGPMGSPIPREGPFEAADLIFLHPNENPDDASHVVIFIDDQHILDSRLNAQNVVGVQVRHRIGWYRDAVLSAWRPIT